MIHLKTYEGFLSKLKDKIFPKEEENKININDVLDTLDECFIELKDNGFEILIEHNISNLYVSRGINNSLDSKFGKDRERFDITIQKIQTEDHEIPNEYVLDYRLRTLKRPLNFKISDIKDSLLNTRDVMISKFGVDIRLDPELDNYIPGDDEANNISSWNIQFDVPI